MANENAAPSMPNADAHTDRIGVEKATFTSCAKDCTHSSSHEYLTGAAQSLKIFKLTGHHASLIRSAPLVRQQEEDNCGDPEFEKVAGPLHLDE